jgi:hypothetical protein
MKRVGTPSVSMRVVREGREPAMPRAMMAAPWAARERAMEVKTRARRERGEVRRRRNGRRGVTRQLSAGGRGGVGNVGAGA